MPEENKKKVLDVFQDIKADFQRRLERRAEKMLERLEKSKNKTQRINEYQKLRIKAEGWKALLSSDKGTLIREMLESSQKHYTNLLKRIGSTENTFEGQALMTARVSGQLEVIDWLLTKPKRIIDDWERKNAMLDKLLIN